MKKGIIITLMLFALIGLTLGAFAQHSEPERKDTQIIVQTDSTNGKPFEQVLSAATSSGFVPALMQPKYNIITWAPMKQNGYELTIYTLIQGDKVIITGALVQSLGMYGSAPGIVDYRLSQFDLRRKAWDIMQSVADKFKHSTITYAP